MKTARCALSLACGLLLLAACRRPTTNESSKTETTPQPSASPPESFIAPKTYLKGFRTKDGKVLFPPRFTEVGAFSDGLAQVREGELWGYVSEDGTQPIAAAFEESLPFSEGLAAVRREGKWGYIDARGQTVLPFRFGQGGLFRGGFVTFSRPGNELLGLMDKSGKEVVSPRFAALWSFENGVAVAEVETDEGRRCGFVDLTGAWLVEPKFDQCSTIERPNARVDERWGYIDRTGAWVVPPRYRDAERFVEGVGAVYVQGRWRFIDAEGKFLTPSFAEVREFRNGVAEVKCDEGGWGAIDKSGRFVQPCDGQRDVPRSDERLAAERRRNWSVIMAAAKQAEVPPKSPLLELTGSAEVRIEGDNADSSPHRRHGLAVLLTPTREIGEVRAGVASFSELGLGRVQDVTIGCAMPYGLMRKDGIELTAPRYSLVGEPSEGVVPVCVPKPGAEKSPYCNSCNCRVGANLCGYVDYRGEARIPLEHHVDFRNRARPEQYVGGFHFGLAAFQDGATTKMGYIDRQGRWVIPPKFAQTKDFADNGLAPASAPAGDVVYFDLKGSRPE